MRKLAISFCFVLALVSCGNDDSSTSKLDPIFSQPYTPLASIDDLEPGIYGYMGNKIGDRSTVIIDPLNANCKGYDTLEIYEGTPREILYINHIYYGGLQTKCYVQDRFPRNIRISRRMSEGIFKITVTYYEYDPTDLTESHTKTWYSGPVEIGFQAGYLRIEDRLSDFRPMSEGHKAYLYFKKKE